MNNSNFVQGSSLKKASLSSPLKAEVISIEDCKKYLDKFNLSDEKIIEIRNYLVGIADKSINIYLDNFR